MSIPTREDVVRRLKAIRDEKNMTAPEFAEWLGVGRTRYSNWESLGPKGNYPSEEFMAHLCDLIPGLTMDYIYRGVLDAVPTKLGIRLTAREQGQDPDAALAPAKAAASVAR
jgi:transcriptional regulator with XRE-family HTH domain